MICGQSDSFRSRFGDNGGVALQFDFPHLGGDSLCQKLVHDIRFAGDDGPSPIRSIFVNEQGLHIGLHQAYIRSPHQDADRLLFTTEQEAGDWWNRTVRGPSLQRLSAMQEELQGIIREHFHTRLSDVEIEGEARWTDYFAWLGRLFGGLSPAQRGAQRATTTESLTLSLRNEFFHYRAGLQHLLTHQQYQALEPQLIATGRCLVELVNSLPEKKYRVIREGCAETLEDVKYELLARQGRYNSESAQAAFLAIPEEALTREQRRDRIIMEFWQKIESLFLEVRRYNEMVNETFNFTLNEDS
jgi:hypothetical protein